MNTKEWYILNGFTSYDEIKNFLNYIDENYSNTLLPNKEKVNSSYILDNIKEKINNFNNDENTNSENLKNINKSLKAEDVKQLDVANFYIWIIDDNKMLSWSAKPIIKKNEQFFHLMSFQEFMKLEKKK